MKQFRITILLTILMSMFGAKAFAHDIEVENSDGVIIYYKWADLEKTKLAVSYRGSEYNSYSNEYTGNVIIPESVDYNGNTYPVTFIGKNAFYYCHGLTSVTIPNSITFIAADAFNGCSGLTSVTIPNSVTSIGSSAFQGCTSLTSVTIPNSVTFIGHSSFYGCSGLTSVTIPNSVTSIDYYAFSNCSGLTSVIVNCSPTSIHDGTFGGCTQIEEVSFDCEIVTSLFSKLSSIKKVTLSENTKTIGARAFQNCSGLTSVTIPNSVTSIGNSAFSGCSSMTSVTIPNSVTSIGEYAFSGCSSMTSVTIPNKVTSIICHTFDGCSGLTSVTIPNSVTSIDFEAFSRCTSLISVTIPSSVTSIGTWAFAYCTGLTSITIPNSVTYIGSSAFQSCTNLTSVTIPNSVTSISDQTFSYCRGLTSVTIPSSVTSIGKSAFYGCKGLTSVIIPDKVTSINDYTFEKCSGLTSLTIPNSVTSIGESAFNGCSSLTSVTIPNSVSSIGESAFQGCSGLSSVTIPKNVISIGESAFKECSDLYTIISEIEAPFDIGYIADYSATLIVPAGTKAAYQSTAGWSDFTKTLEAGEGGLVGIKFGVDGIYYTIGENNTVSLTSANKSVSGAVAIPSQLEYNGKKYDVTSIDYKAFYNFSGLTSVTIPNSVTSIDREAFYGCSSMTSATISNSVTSIDYWAFKYCNSLNSVKVPVTDFSAFCNNKIINIIISAIGKPIHLIDNEGTEITEYIVPNDVTSIGKSAFIGCRGLTSLIIPNSVTSIGESAFQSCSGLTSVTIPNSVTSIGEYAFYNCSGLASVTIPNSVTSISGSAFEYCSGLTSVIIGSGVLSIGSNAFLNTNLKKTIWLTNTPPSGYNYAKGTVNYVSNDQFNIDNKVVYKYLSSHFVVDGIRYVPVSPSDRTCDAIDCTYDTSIENINIGETVTNKSVMLTVMKVNPYTCYQNKYIKDVKLSLGGDVGDYAFYGCAGLISATVSNKGSIGEYAFRSCPALETANISNIGDVGAYAFYSCPVLKTATISNQGNIGKNAFESCSAMTTVNITSQGDIDECAFLSCSALTTATINNQGGIGRAAFSGCSLLESAKLGKNVTSIGSYAFNECSKLKSIVIPNAVNTLGSYAFQNCAAMTSAKTGNGIETIDEYTFSGCSSLKEMNIGTKVKTINQYAFSGCSSLSAITIPQAVTTIGNKVFSECTSLAKVTFDDSETTLTLGSNGSSPIFSSCPLDYVYIGRDISYQTSSSYGYSPFYRNTTLREVIITDKETEISENEFYGCTNLQTVTIDDGVTSIGNWAFSGCQSLKFFTFGSKVKTIGQEAFSDCTAVTEISSRAITPPICGSQALDDINKWDCTLYVPKGHLAYYQAAEQWKDFFFAEERDYGILFESITIGKSGKASYCGDMSLDFSFSEEVKAYISTGFDKDEGIIWLTRVKDVPAGVPVLIKGDANKTYDVPVTDSENSYYTNMFVGNTTGETIKVGETEGDKVNYYLSGDGTFKSVNKSVNIGNNKSYLQLPSTFNSAVEGSTQTVTIKASGKASYAAPVDLDFTNVEGLKAFTATGYDKSTKTIWLTRVMKVQKGEGVLLKGDAKDYEIPSAAVQSSYMNMFVGNIGEKIQVPETSEDGSQTNFYLNSNGAFVSVNGFVNLGNNKCYLELPTEMVAAAASTRGAEANYILEEPEMIKLPISFRSIDNDGDGTTGIKVQPSMSNVPSDAYYTLQGQRVVNPGKGLYIKNGRKVVIRSTTK